MMDLFAPDGSRDGADFPSLGKTAAGPRESLAGTVSDSPPNCPITHDSTLQKNSRLKHIRHDLD
jgi:hypothetical protein